LDGAGGVDAFTAGAAELATTFSASFANIVGFKMPEIRFSPEKVLSCDFAIDLTCPS